jgi:hydroxyethylthiazole kinase-like uncharacterized protein yjeF
MTKIVTTEEIQSIDRQAIDEYELPGSQLMESAGRCVADAIGRNFPRAHRIAVVCGPGNNGGDGLVVARTWKNRGGQVDLFLTAAAEKYTGDAAVQMKRAQRCQLPLKNSSEAVFQGYDVLVDAIFGTGLKRAIEGDLAELLARMNSSRIPIVAVDIPSGIDSTLGTLLGRAVNAQLTVTFGLAKLGHFLEPGAAHRGRLEVHDIGYPRQLLQTDLIKGELGSVDELCALVPARGPSGHKGKFGRVALVVGSEEYPGAAVLSSRSALRSGAGMVYAICPASLRDIVVGQNPEVILRPREESKPGTKDWWAHELQDKKALGIGPGLGQGDQEMVKLVLQTDLPPCVIDADALRVVPELPAPSKVRNWILTPHHGEAARLLDWPIERIETDRLAAALEIARLFQAVTVLKGGPTLVAEPDGKFWVNISGGPALSQAGTGDVLTGLLTALLGQGLTPGQAARLGVYVHGRSADLLQGASQRGLQAHEVADGLPAVFDELQTQRGAHL